MSSALEIEDVGQVVPRRSRCRARSPLPPRRARRARRARRTVGERQVDDAPPHRRARPSELGPHPRARPRRDPPSPPRSLPARGDRGDLPAPQPAAAPRCAAERRGRDARRQAPSPAAPRRGRRRCWPPCASTAASTFARPSSRAANASASRSRALANDPKLLLADEPTGSLDDDNAAVVIGMLRERCESGGAVLAVSHDPEAHGRGDARAAPRERPDPGLTCRRPTRPSTPSAQPCAHGSSGARPGARSGSRRPTSRSSRSPAIARGS